MAKVKYIRCDIYKRGIYVFIGTPDEFKKWIRSVFNEDNDDLEFVRSAETCSYGIADFHYGNGYGIVRLPKFPKTPEEIAYTTHELLHATIWLLWYSGVSYNNEGNIHNEAYTYLLEHLVRNTFKKEGYATVK